MVSRRRRCPLLREPSLLSLLGLFWLGGATALPSWCGKLDTKGFTVPSGDILIRAGRSLNITCNLYESCPEYGDKSSSRLYFERDGKIIPSEMVEILNSTSVRLYIENVNVTKNDNYYCLFNASESKEFICMNTVVVGVPPREVTDFSCISRNFENMTCSWTPPNNYIATHYKLSYSLMTNNKRTRRMLMYSCNHLEVDTKMSCFWNISTHPQYRQVYSTFNFVLNMTNALGTRSLNYTFEHDKHVLPNPPVNLTATAVSPSTIELYWEIPQPVQMFKPGLTHRVLYQCEFEKRWTFAGLTRSPHKAKSVQFVLEGLRYPHAWCDIRVASRSAVADEDDESMWSGNATRTVRTLSREPDRPPETTPGSFEIVNVQAPRKVYIYWKQIEEYEQNGQDFRYVVEAENDPSLIPIENTSSYAKFENLREEDYVFNIWSENEVGRSHRRSVVLVPRKPLTRPDPFVKIAHYDGLFELSWKPPMDGSEIINYTVFWCNSDRDRPYQCSGKLDWNTVPGDQNRYNQSLPSTSYYQFAIAANSLYSSSGMLWAGCTVLVSKDQLLGNVWINDNGPDFIEVKWDVKCPGFVNPSEGFLISYCPVNALPKSSEKCIGEMKNQTIASENPSTQSGRITGLKPATTYLLQVRVKYSNNTYSTAVQTMRNITRETAPTPPRDLLVTEVTNSSVSLKWTPPREMNGALRYYKIYYNDHMVNTTESYVSLTNLKSFTEYNLIVEACTSACTNMSGYRSVRTKISTPSRIERPILDEGSNSTIVVIKWEQPENRSGNLDYYQLLLTESRGPVNVSGATIVNVTGALHYSLSCDSSPSYVSVRAVNVDENGRNVYGEWSLPVKVFPCTQSMKVFYIILIVSLIAFGVLLIFGVRRMFNFLNTCRRVEVKLPPGLDPVVWMPERTTVAEDGDRNSGADQLLLQDKFSGNESGISSGHESITSSVESGGTHLTASDSGNEQPRSLPIDDTRKNSLRQRNVSSKGYVLAEDLATQWKAKPAPAASGNYCVLGVATPKQQDAPDKPSDPGANIASTSPYVSTDLPSSQPSPYVMAGGDFHKTLNPSYVPFEACKPAEKNTGYVMAGVSDSLQYNPPVAKQQLAEEKPLYVRAGDTLKPPLGAQVLPWLKQQPQQQQQPVADSLTKSGYVSVGSALPPAKGPAEVSKGGYVPHQQFEAKSLKED